VKSPFGLHLLEDTRADRVLQAVPNWLRPYVRLDGAAYLNDLERVGVYSVADIDRGICVFDGPIAKSWQQKTIVDRQ